MTEFFDGVHYLFAGFNLITKPGLKRFVIIPLVINILLFTALFFVLQHYTGILHDQISAYLPAWLQWLAAIIWVLFVVGFFFLFIYAFAVLGAITAAPFNGLLAEKVELYLTGKEPVSRSLIENVKDVPRIIGRQFVIVWYYLPRALLIMLLFFVPVVHVIAFLLWFLFSAWFLTLQYLDFPTDNHRIPVASVRSWLDQRRALALGFGVSLMFVMAIPFVNFFAIPAAAAGAAKLWIEENNRKPRV